MGLPSAVETRRTLAGDVGKRTHGVSTTGAYKHGFFTRDTSLAETPLREGKGRGTRRGFRNVGSVRTQNSVEDLWQVTMTPKLT